MRAFVSTRLALIAALTLAPILGLQLGGCTGAAPVAAVSDTVVLESTRGLLIADYAYKAAATTALAAVRAGLIKGQTARNLRDVNAKASAALIKAHAARDAIERAAAVATLFEEIGRINALLPQGTAQ